MKTMTMPSANISPDRRESRSDGYQGCAAPILIEKIIDSELGAHCALYARVTIPVGSILGYHEHHGNGESYFILSGRAVYDDNGQKREIGPGDATWTPSGSGHGVDNSTGTEPLVFMALIVNE